MAINEYRYDSYTLPVPTAFEDVFSHFYFAENSTEQPVTKTLMPSYQTLLIFSFGAPASLISQQDTKVSINKCLVLGPVKQAFQYTLPANAQILAANFKEDAFYRFFGNTVLSGRMPLDPDTLLPQNCFTSLWLILHKMKSAQERMECILEFCKPYLRDRNPVTQLLSSFNDEALNPIKAIAGQTQQSERSIQLNHKKYFGYSAKEISRYQRFIKAVEMIGGMASGAAKVDWFEVTENCGYYDQSQLIHDFRHFINLSPTKFLKFQQDICQAKP